MKQAGNIDWFSNAGSSASLMPITHFVDGDVFATRTGGYGACFRLSGIDGECLSDGEMETVGGEITQSLALIPSGATLYQIARKRRGAWVSVTQQRRAEHLASLGFFTIDLFWVVYVPAPKRSSNRRVASADQITQVERITTSLLVNMRRFGIERLSESGICELYGYLLNLHTNVPPPSRDAVADDLACETLRWHDDTLRIGSRYAWLFSLLRTPSETVADHLGQLLRTPGEIVLVLESQRQSAEETRGAVSGHETFTNIFRENILTMLSYLGNQAALDAKPQSANAKAASTKTDGLAGIIKDLDNGVVFTRTSLIGLIHSDNKTDLGTQMAHVQREAGKAKASVLHENVGAMSAYMAIFPGSQVAGRSSNVRQRWLREDHLRDLSLVFAPNRGEAYSKTLQDEALTVFETRDGTPFHYNPYTSGGLRGAFVTGESGRGKSFLVNHLIDNEVKYGGFVFVFDVGCSYENTILSHGGSVVRFGLTGPRLNPFSLPDIPENHRFVQRLVRMLLSRGGVVITPQQEEDLNTRVTRMFSLDRSIRRLKHLVLPPAIQPYLRKWIEGGAYGHIFDNVQDELQFSRMVAFDFEALGEGAEQKDLTEPLLAWIRWRIAAVTQDEANLNVPKLEVYDEAWRHMKDPEMQAMIINTSKTARKHKGGIILATQSIEDLGSFAQMIRTNCPDLMMLGGPVDPRIYTELFGVNAHQLGLIKTLQRGEFLFTRNAIEQPLGFNPAKILKLSVDKHSYWTYTTDPNERRIRNEAIAKHGRQQAIQHLAETASK